MEYKILEQLCSNKIFSEKILCICFLHLREDLIEFLFSLEKSGCPKKNIYITGPPYSYQKEIKETLYKEYNFIEPKEDLSNVKEILDLVKDKIEINSKIFIIEDGGHIVPLLHKEMNSLLKKCIGAVEQTTRGIKLDEEIENLKIPIASIPDCNLKKVEESPFIAQATRRNLENILNTKGDILPGKRIGIIGFGSIGTQLAKLLDNDCHIHIAEINFQKQLRAKLSGYDTEKSIKEMVQKCHIVIGTTGNCTINEEVFKFCRDDIYLASTSSRQVEIDIRALNQYGKMRKKEHYYNIFDLPNGTVINLIYEGYPINFALGFSLPKPIADMIYSLMFSAAEKMLTITYNSEICKCLADENLIAKLYLKNYLQ